MKTIKSLVHALILTALCSVGNTFAAPEYVGFTVANALQIPVELEIVQQALNMHGRPNGNLKTMKLARHTMKPGEKYRLRTEKYDQATKVHLYYSVGTVRATIPAANIPIVIDNKVVSFKTRPAIVAEKKIADELEPKLSNFVIMGSPKDMRILHVKSFIQ